MKPRAALSLLVLVVAACGGGPPDAEDPADSGPPPVPVFVTEAEIGDLEITLRAVGLAEARYDTTLTAETPVQVLRRRYAVGDRVGKGAALLAVDDSLLRSQATQAEARVQQASDALALREHEHAAASELHAQGKLSDQLLLQAKLGLSSGQADLAGAKATFTQARDALNRASMPAPFTGRVAAWMVNAGDRLAPGLPVVRLTAVDPILVRFGASERQVARLEAEQVVRALPRDGAPIEGRVSAVAPASDPRSRTWSVEVELPNEDGRLHAGAVVELEVVTEVMTGRVMVPTKALEKGDAPAVWIVAEDGTASRRAVRLGAEHGERAAITEGLKAGERVVTGGRENLEESSRVEILEP